ncbi:MAG: hypothetical protein B6241_02380 [Spirochaetaceae bacterium 4572_59]|nr:MAG: hypothetical protein B6241_02380 [Spirochaetaceae bacterium 4572_59]
MINVKKVQESGNRDAILLEQDSFRVMIDADKGMIPELSLKKGDGWINAHWQPWFRANSGEEWDKAKHAPFWKVPLLYDISGNFPCAPNFGPGHTTGGYDLPPHGYTSFKTWEQKSPILLEKEKGAAFSSTLNEGKHPFRYKKQDLILEGQNVHYSRLDITNTGESAEPYNCGWHNTVGSPFLESGCLIDNNAGLYGVPGEGTEFDTTGELAFGAQSDSLEEMPLRQGGTKDMRRVCGISGYTDFITGAVPQNCSLGWNSIVNPRQKLVYLSFFTGPAAIEKKDIPLYFYDLWLNYGGRNFQPWAVQDGQNDRTFCLGAENATGYFANGLAEALENPTLLGNPSYLTLPAGETRSLNYGTLFQSYPDEILNEGVKSVEPCDEGLILNSYTGKFVKVAAEWDFKTLSAL